MPYYGYNSDLAVFGLMSTDLARHGYLPTLMYGQDYLLSVTPYLGAGAQFLGTESFLSMRLAGLLLSYIGIWLTWEAFLLRHRGSFEAKTYVAFVFPILLLTTPMNYFSSLNRFDSTELTHFCLGAGLFLSVCSVPYDRYKVCWLGVGAMLGYTYCCRPQSLIYTGAVLFAVHGLGLRKWHRIGPLLLGACIGYVPMLLHKLLRASRWPEWAIAPKLELGNLQEISNQSRVLFGEILPWTWQLRDSHQPATWMASVFLGAVILSLVSGKLSRVSYGLAGGAATTLLLLMTVKNLTVDLGSARYCVTLPLIGVWCVCEAALKDKRHARILLLFSCLFLLTSLPTWREVNREAERASRSVESSKTQLLEVLPQDRLIFADYWDAYDFAFLVDDQIPFESLPYQTVRRVGAFSPILAKRKSPSLFLIRQESLPEFQARLSDAGFDFRDLQQLGAFRLRDRDYILLSPAQEGVARGLLGHYRGSYFQDWDIPSWRP